jgi:hypothetical protein
MKKPTNTAKATLAGESSNAILPKIDSTNAQTQRDFILRHLAKQPSLTTTDFRDAGIMMPNARIWELRQAGWNIETTLETVYDHAGVKHGRVARYRLARVEAGGVSHA